MSSYTTTDSEKHVGHVRSGLETANPPVTHQGTRSNPCSDAAGAAQTYPYGCHVKQRVKCPDPVRSSGRQQRSRAKAMAVLPLPVSKATKPRRGGTGTGLRLPAVVSVKASA
jgi:hypothetical protein